MNAPSMDGHYEEAFSPNLHSIIYQRIKSLEGSLLHAIN